MSVHADYFRSAMRETAEAIDIFMGEQVYLTPVTNKPNFQGVADESKTVNRVAVFSWISETEFTNPDSKRVSGNRDMDIAPLITTRKPRFSFQSNCLPFPILRGYRIIRCVDSTLWEVTSAKPDGVSRIAVAVVQLGRSHQ